jgi:excisionase family DNA binding protein
MAIMAENLARELDLLSARLREQGQPELVAAVNRVRAEVERALGEAVASAPREMLTTTEAAALLGVRSINTIKRWASEGRLEGFRLGSRVLVSRQSVEQMRQDAALGRQRAYEQGLAEALAPLSATAEDADDVAALTGQAHQGRKPWAARAAVDA